MEIKYTTLDGIKYPEILYKYRCWNNEYHKRFINEREVYMASPDEFEDKEDCKIPFRFDLLTQQQIKEYCKSSIKSSEPNLNREQRRKKKHLMAKTFKCKKKNEEHQKRYFEIFCQRTGILSLTAENCSDDMWKKYADDYKGFCIGYHSKNLFKAVGGGGDVIYYEETPIILPALNNSLKEVLESDLKQIFSKNRKWKFEKEDRTHKSYPKNASKTDRRIHVPKEVFHAVILGKNMSKEDKEDIKQAIKENIGNIDIIEYKNIC